MLIILLHIYEVLQFLSNSLTCLACNMCSTKHIRTLYVQTFLETLGMELVGVQYVLMIRTWLSPVNQTHQKIYYLYRELVLEYSIFSLAFPVPTRIAVLEKSLFSAPFTTLQQYIKMTVYCICQQLTCAVEGGEVEFF